MIINKWALGEKDAQELYRILRKAGILQSKVAGRIIGADLDIHTTYEKRELETKRT